MGRDHDEDDRGGERERKRHKKDRHHDRELSQSRSRQKDKTRDTSKRRDDKVCIAFNATPVPAARLYQLPLDELVASDAGPSQRQ